MAWWLLWVSSSQSALPTGPSVHGQDMSDDEKPLGYRVDELERKQKRQVKRQAAAAEGGVPRGAPKPGTGGPKRTAQRAAAAEPAQRRRREAAAGVAAAVQALAAAQAAAAADGEALLHVSQQKTMPFAPTAADSQLCGSC